MNHDLFMETRAVLSPDRLYRYRLSRIWESRSKPVCFVMLNPSTADELADDATIRRCKGFALSWRQSADQSFMPAVRYGGIEVVNLFAYRATDPKEMMKAAHPIGPENDHHIIEAVKRSGIVVCAWGVNGGYMQQDRWILQLLFGLGITPHYLQLTADGAPRHPLRLRADLKPQPWTFPQLLKEAA